MGVSVFIEGEGIVPLLDDRLILKKGDGIPESRADRV